MADDLFKITYVTTYTRIPRCKIEAERLTWKFPVTYTSHTSIQDIYSSLSNSGIDIDAVVIDSDYLYADDNVDAFCVLNTLNTLIKSTVVRKVHGTRPESRTTKIWIMADLAIKPEQLRELSKIKFVSGIVTKIGVGVDREDLEQSTAMIISSEYGIHPKLAELMKPKKKPVVVTNNKAPELTMRQSQILKLVTERGISNKVIAKTLNITESTVKLHMSGLLKKFGCKNRTQLAVFSKTGPTKTQAQTLPKPEPITCG